MYCQQDCSWMGKLRIIYSGTTVNVRFKITSLIINVNHVAGRPAVFVMRMSF